MTRAKEFLFGTWAGQRRGPTARAGRARVRLHRQHCHFFVGGPRSEEHTSELQSPDHLVCRLLLEKKKKTEIWPAAFGSAARATARQPCAATSGWRSGGYTAKA